ESQTQRIVMQHELLDDTLQLVSLKRLFHLQQHRLVEVMRLGHLLLEEGTLNRSQGNLAGGKTLRRRRGRSSGNRDLREVSDGLMTKDEFRRKFKTCLICACDDLD